MLFVSLVAATLVVVGNAMRGDYSPRALQDQITDLPGLPAGANFTMFSGYINAAPTETGHARYIFYWFVESLNDPENDPVFYWTNGGPGCSGLGGFMTEQGPFRALEDESLELNPTTWVNVANGLFVEQPAGVGFSYPESISDLQTGDAKAAMDNYHFIQGWLDQFDNYKSNDFYITSESYGGHYMPTLAKEITQGNDAGGDPQINLKGVFVGNPYTDPVENAIGMYDTWYGHQMVSYPTWQNWYTACDNGAKSGLACDVALVEMNEEIGDVDPYALDYPVCRDAAGAPNNRYWFLKHVVRDSLKRPIPRIYEERAKRHDELMLKLKADPVLRSGEFPDPDYEQCAEDYATAYLNRADVQKAIHVNGTVRWSDCSYTLDYNRTDSEVPMEPYWQWLVSNSDLRMTVVSGDDDSVCGTVGTQSWVWDLGYSPSHDVNWQSWTYDQQVAGYLTKFVTNTDAEFNFLTVHSGGHMIPQTQGARSLESFTNFLAGKF